MPTGGVSRHIIVRSTKIAELQLAAAGTLAVLGAAAEARVLPTKAESALVVEASDDAHWVPGDHVVLRQLWPGRVWAAVPATVVEDTASVVVLYVRPGTTFAGPACSREEHLRVAASGHWDFRRAEWVG